MIELTASTSANVQPYRVESAESQVTSSVAGADSGTQRQVVWARDRDEQPLTSQSGIIDASPTRSARMASRELVRQVSPEQRSALFAEHGQLVDKEFTEGLSASDERRLAYLRWQLDRLEDAEIGGRIDQLEHLTAVQESLAEQVRGFVRDVRAAARPAKPVSRR